MPRGCDHSVWVDIDVTRSATAGHKPRAGIRKFIVEFDADGLVIRIKERKTYGTYPLNGVYNAPYWKAGTHALGNGDTLPKRIIAAAYAKLRAEHRAADATP